MMDHRPNLLIIGASGGVAAALLLKLTPHRKELNRLVLVDRTDCLLRNPYLSHEELRYEFIPMTVDAVHALPSYQGLLIRSSAHIVIDLTVGETRPILKATDEMGASYINTGIANRPGESFLEVVLDILRHKELGWRCPHILCAGMNPGIANLWVREGIEEFGVPEEIVHFEYDTAEPVEGWIPLISWSRETLLDEIINDPAGYMEGRGRPREFYPNPIKNRVCMEDVLRPIIDLAEYPRGLLLLHEENITIAERYDVPSRFLFSIHPKAMDYLETLYDRKGMVALEELALGDNREIRLKGEAAVGVLLRYPDRGLYYFNRTPQGALPGFSGSCLQVAAGLHAALFTLLAEPLLSRVYFAEDLFGTCMGRLIRENLPFRRLMV